MNGNGRSSRTPRDLALVGRLTLIALALAGSAWASPARAQAVDAGPPQDGCWHLPPDYQPEDEDGDGIAENLPRCFCECMWSPDILLQVTGELEPQVDDTFECQPGKFQRRKLEVLCPEGRISGDGRVEDNCNGGNAHVNNSQIGKYAIEIKLIRKCPCCRGREMAHVGPQFYASAGVAIYGGNANTSVTGEMVVDSAATGADARAYGSIRITADTLGGAAFVEVGVTPGIVIPLSGSGGYLVDGRDLFAFDPKNDTEEPVDLERIDAWGSASLSLNANGTLIDSAEADASIPLDDSATDIRITLRCRGGCEREYTIEPSGSSRGN